MELESEDIWREVALSEAQILQGATWGRFRGSRIIPLVYLGRDEKLSVWKDWLRHMGLVGSARALEVKALGSLAWG